MSAGGEIVSHYRILEKLGEGGMGVVYKALDERLNRHVALKFLPEALRRDDVARRRFDAEARAASALDHPNICSIYDVGEAEDGRLYLALAYCEGETLRARMARGPMPAREAVRIARQIADGLSEAHQKGIIHRDIKPSNLMVRPDGLVKILDFGVAKLQGDADITKTSTTVGSPAYMAPEQVQGRAVTPAADVWSAGVVLYELLAGRRAFGGGPVTAVMYSILHESPTPLGRLRPELPPGLPAIVERCLEKHASRRYQHAGELAQALGTLDAGSTATLTLAATAATLASHSAPDPMDASVAVLPFSDLSPARDQDWFCEGLAEELIDALTQVPQLRTASRASTAQFRDHLDEPHVMGERLHVANLLQGSVRRFGDRVRITTQLVRADDGTVLTSNRFDREMNDIFALQEEIARSVVETLRVHLDRSVEAPVVAPPTDSITAYNLYLKGRHHWNRRSGAGFEASQQLFEQALERDPGYARAHAGLADLHIARAIYGLAEPEAAMTTAKDHCERALALDPRLAEARAALGQILAHFEWAWNDAEQAYLEAIGLGPRYAMARVFYGNTTLLPQARVDEALAQIDAALALDPISLPINCAKGFALYLARRPAEAERQLLSTLEIDPGFDLARALLAEVVAVAGRPDEALERLDSASADGLVAGGLAAALAGRGEEALGLLDRLEASSPDPYYRALVHVGLGELDTAVEELERAAERRSPLLIWVGQRPAFDPVRSHPRFPPLLRRMGLPVTGSRVPPVSPED